MATVTDLTTTPLSGMNWIDALLDDGPDWNYLTPAGNTLQYTFSVTTGNEAGKSGQEAFTLAQQNWVRYALNELSTITGIKFVETTGGDAAQLHFANIDIKDSSLTTGLCSWNTNYGYNTQTNELTSYTADAYVYLDNNEWYAQNRDLTPGGYGYETLLHELGHAMGLKHPFDGTVHLPAAQDNTANTLMSYTDAGGPYQHYSQYDVAALDWLYGGDGLRGALGINSASGARYITGTNGDDALVGTTYDDTLEGDGGNDHIDGGAGTDTAVFRGARGDYAITLLSDGSLRVAGSSALDGTDTLTNIEILKFADISVQRAQLGTDTTPPAAPTLSVAENANGYAAGNTPVVTGSAEPNSTVKVYLGKTVVGTAQVDSSGLWSLTTAPFDDGMNYSIFATATDAAGNTSVPSAAASFNIDAHAPGIPTGGIALAQGSNQGSFTGTAEAGTMIELVRVTDATVIGQTVAAASNTWVINSDAMPNGNYIVSVVSVDAADNATSGAQQINFTVNSTLNMAGDTRANTFTPGAGNNAIDGGAGLDTAVYAAPRANFTVKHEVWGYSVQDNVGDGGKDTLLNVERVQFSDGTALALDVNGEAGQVYRIYQAAFDRTPDPGGFAYWLDAMDKGTSLDQVAQLFMQSKEAADLYTATDPSDTYFVTQLYHHVLHREPDAAGLAWWLDNVHKLTRPQVLETFSESPENQAQVIGTIQDGIQYTPWHG
jgi:hypothetical protein